jgi:hypothetical protein
MIMKINIKDIAIISLLAVNSASFSSTEGQSANLHSNFRFAAYLGPNWARIPSSNLYFIGETDTLHSSTRPTDFSWGLGGAYQWFPSNANPMNLHDISLGVDLFSFKTTQEGKVWQYDLPALYNYNYQLPLTNWRLMLNTELTMQALSIFNNGHDILPFIELGIGLSRNKLSYSDMPISGIADLGLNINSNTVNQFAWDIGAGFKMPFQWMDHHFEASLRYLYTDLNHAHSSDIANATITAPINVKASTQTLFFGCSVQV